MKYLILALIPFTLIARAPSYTEHKSIEFYCDYIEHSNIRTCIDEASNCFDIMTESPDFIGISTEVYIDTCVEISKSNDSEK